VTAVQSTPADSTVLQVDADDLLPRSSLLQETLVKVLTRRPWLAPCAPFWLLRERSALWKSLAQHGQVDVQLLPWSSTVLADLRAQQAAGSKLLLTSTAHPGLVQAIAADLQLFDRVATPTPTKTDAIARWQPPSTPDASVWQRLRQGLRLIRVYQWVKNLLVFLPLLAAHRLADPLGLQQCATAFLCFSVLASSAYVLNDLCDIEADRAHPRKRLRPLASGAIAPVTAVWLALLLLVAGVFLALRLSPLFQLAAAGYLGGTLLYSFLVKRLVGPDVLWLAGLYTLRVLGGAAATQITPSFWLLAFSIFLFLSLALVKRVSELAAQPAGTGQLRNRGYLPADLEALTGLGTASGLGAVIVLALYIRSPEVLALYARPYGLWLLCPLLLYWIMRVWLGARRGWIREDPIVFAFRDPQSLALFALAGLILVSSAGVRP
jgi:4-hydroxybenzoate polyprenyltransferase